MALSTNLVSYYKMEGNSNDSVGSNNGTDTAISYSTGNGKIGQGAGFNGSSSKIKLPDNFSGNSLTFNAWIKPVNVTSNVVLWEESDSNYASINITNGGGVTLGNKTSTSSQAYFTSSTTPIAGGNWYMITYVYDSSSGFLTGYSNGISIISQNIGGNQSYKNDATNYIGSYAGSSNFFNGAIDEVGIWSRALSTTEITQLYNNGFGMTYPLIAHIATLSDSSSYGASRTVTIARILGSLRTLTVSMINSAGRLATLTKGYARALSDSIMNSASRFTTLNRLATMVRTLTASIMNGASRFVSLSSFLDYLRSLTDNIMNGASRFVTITRLGTFGRKISDSIMNAVGRFTLLKGVPSAIHTIWNILNRPITPTSWNGITKSATTWITKITGQ